MNPNFLGVVPIELYGSLRAYIAAVHGGLPPTKEKIVGHLTAYLGKVPILSRLDTILGRWAIYGVTFPIMYPDSITRLARDVGLSLIVNRKVLLGITDVFHGTHGWIRFSHVEKNAKYVEGIYENNIGRFIDC